MSQSKVVSVRLDPPALAILESKQDPANKIGNREIITDALHRASDKPIELHHNNNFEKNLIEKIKGLQLEYNEQVKETDWDQIFSRMETLLENKVTDILQDFSKHIISSILTDIKQGTIDPYAEKPFGDDSKEKDYRQKMAEAMKARQEDKKG